jgi:urease accessory protein
MPIEASCTRISVSRPPGGGRAVVSLETSGPSDRPVIRPMLHSADAAGAVISLVPEGALLLAGDAVAIDVSVGAGARLELQEPAGTVAYAMKGGSASWAVTITLGPAASLVWAGEPLVVAAGADVIRTTRVRLGWGAMLALRETLVLGRHGEAPGRIRQDFVAIGQNDVPVLSESLDVGPEAGPLVMGGTRVLGSVLTLGYRTPRAAVAPSVAYLDLAGMGTMARALAHQVHDVELGGAWDAARRELVSRPGRSAPESQTPGRRPQPSTRPG